MRPHPGLRDPRGAPAGPGRASGKPRAPRGAGGGAAILRAGAPRRSGGGGERGARPRDPALLGHSGARAAGTQRQRTDSGERSGTLQAPRVSRATGRAGSDLGVRGARSAEEVVAGTRRQVWQGRIASEPRAGGPRGELGSPRHRPGSRSQGVGWMGSPSGPRRTVRLFGPKNYR